MRARRVVIFGFIFSVLLAGAFGFYLWNLYEQLKTAFNTQEQFVPTRIYSDLTRLSIPETRSFVTHKLKSLAYPFQATDSEINFVLHPTDYPFYLLPEGHPQIDAQFNSNENFRKVTLQFSGAAPDALLQSMQLNGREVSDLYLEPELVTALSRGGKSGEKKEIRTLVKLQDISPQIPLAIKAVEDPHFDDHKGFDPKGLIRAIFVNIKHLSWKQGGSTITQQLVKNLMARKNKNIFRKINELFLSILLEYGFEKDQIMERYLNEVYLGQVGSYEVHGVAEGAEHFFGKDLKSLNLAETAFLAGLIRGPAYYSPHKHYNRALDRQRFVLKKMVEAGFIAQAEMHEANKMSIRLAPPSTVANKAPYFAEFVKAELIRHLQGKVAEEDLPEAGLRVYTTLDLAMNASAQNAVTNGIQKLETNLKLPTEDRLEGALASVEHTTGTIRALVGGRNYAKSTFNRILNMKRQVGSTFKPFVFLSAFQKGYDLNGVPYSPGHPIEDAPWTLIYDKKRQTWTPKNYEKEYLGWISYRTALSHSVNTATAKIGYEVGIPSIIEISRSLGITSELPQVPSLSLGVAELSPIELLRAYAAIANYGIQDELTAIRAITQEDGTLLARFIYHPKQVVDAGASALLTDMMTQVFSDGTASAAINMGFDRPAAGKTGTTSHHRDAWFAGFTPQLTTVVWVGMDQPKEKTKVKLTGANAALPIWVDFMKTALEGEPPATFMPSPHLVEYTIDKRTGLRAEFGCSSLQMVAEKFIQGKEPRMTSCAEGWPLSQSETVGD